MAIVEDQTSLGLLFESSPAHPARTSPAAAAAFCAGVAAILGSPFSLTAGASTLLGVVALLLGILGLAQASRDGVAGGLLAALALVLALGTLALVGVRYAGIDTTVGDAWLPSIVHALRWLTALLPHR